MVSPNKMKTQLRSLSLFIFLFAPTKQEINTLYDMLLIMHHLKRIVGQQKD